jgi:hypothetical protein
MAKKEHQKSEIFRRLVSTSLGNVKVVNSVPLSGLDEHVIAESKYLDVLQSKYEIKSLPHNQIKLYLTSQFRLSTRFNFYSY